MQEYVLGFVFFEEQVLLVKKTKPKWQKGKLNGIGGKVEDTDKTLLYAMEREAFEEARVQNVKWVKKGAMAINNKDKLGDVVVHVFSGHMGIRPMEFTTKEGPTKLIPVHCIEDYNCMDNLKILIPLTYIIEKIHWVYTEVGTHYTISFMQE